MADDEEFVQLVQDTMDGLDELLERSQHNSWPSLRAGYGELRGYLDRRETLKELRTAKEALEQMRAATADTKANAEARWRDTQAETANWSKRRHAAWFGQPRAARVHRILNIVGEDRKTVSELARVLEAQAQAEHGADVHIFYSDILPFVKDMVSAGELVKVQIGSHGTQPRYAYERNRVLSPELSSLERAASDKETA